MNAKHHLVKIILTLVAAVFGYWDSCAQLNPHSGFKIGPQYGIYSKDYETRPDIILELRPPIALSGNTIYRQWQESERPYDGFIDIAGETGVYYRPPILTKMMFYREKIICGNVTDYSNTVKYEVVSKFYEEKNYVRQHTVLFPEVTNWIAVDQLKTADFIKAEKTVTTSYMDGLGRAVQQVAKNASTPTQGNTTLGDLVQFKKYDEYGREQRQYLPYTTVANPNMYKANAESNQAQYYSSAPYNETNPYTNIDYYNDPLTRARKVNAPGYSWDASRNAGNTNTLELNDALDEVQIFSIVLDAADYATVSQPIHLGTYNPTELYKTTHIDEHGKKVVEFTNKEGQVILTKTQEDDSPGDGHSGWSCVYSIYDHFGQLRFRFQPNAVQYLKNNNWSFAGADGQTVLNELCFRYAYDEKGRNIVKKAPGAKELQMIYDSRDRVVFMQDGNQAAMSPPQWTVNLYDELDRPTITLLYNTNKTRTVLQDDLNRSLVINNNTITNPTTIVPVLELPIRESHVAQYNAETEIDFLTGFETGSNDNGFVAEIINNTPVPGYVISTALYRNPISDYDLNHSQICTILKYQFYDDYSYTAAKPFDIAFDNTNAYASNGIALPPIVATKRTLSLATGSMTRILGTNTFLVSTTYYDDQERMIQNIEDNMKSGRDVITMQYHWNGTLVSTHKKHTTSSPGYQNFNTLTKNNFDFLWRIRSVEKKYETNPFKEIAAYEYDQFGRLKKKRLAPTSPTDELESLEYSYDLQSKITGINKDYALKTVSTYDKWSHYFGMYLGYDNRDNVFSTGAGRTDGRVAGILWNTQGDDEQRKYEYEYDNAGRLTKATFNQYDFAGGIWKNDKMDFSVGGRNGKIEYDFNGNLKFMLQKSVLPGNQTPINLDDLAYLYPSYSNKLNKVTDNGNAGNANGSFGDFKDGNNTNGDYEYDDNGNVVIDRNKNAADLGNVNGTNGIHYNFLDKPDEIHIKGKGVIKLVYDADGNKLQKIFIAENANGVPTGNRTTTTYINEFVYQQKDNSSGNGSNDLQYINFEEGRIRIIQPVSQNNGYDGLTISGSMTMPNNKSGVYDYYIRDYQENVRMILTDENHNSSSRCSMETTRATIEQQVFGQTGADNEVDKTRIPISDIPGQALNNGWNNTAIQQSVSKLFASNADPGKKTGPNVLLKVMAGDVINAHVQYYYQNAANNSNTNNTLATDVVSALVSALSGSAAVNAASKEAAAAIQSNLIATPPFNSIAAPDAANTLGDNPKAYLTVLYFDERFNFVAEGSTNDRVTQRGTDDADLTISGIKVPKNGYAFVYVSNGSAEPVYFDNLQVAHNRGRIIEENHYYPFGLTIAALSSKKLGDALYEGHLENNNLYNDKELFEDGDLDWYEYGFRSYDAQIGRFMQMDPLTDRFPDFSPFLCANNDLINNVDLFGLSLAQTTIGEVFKGAVNSVQSTVTVVGKVNKAAQLAKAGSTAMKVANIALKTADIVTDFIPIVGGAKDIYNGVKNGNGLQVALGVGSIVLDIFTFGSSSVAKGVIKTAVREGVEIVAKKEAKELLTTGIIKELPKFGCFIKGTPVWTADSTKAIERIRAGDYVYAYDLKNRHVVRKKVTKAYIREVNQLVKINYGNEVIYTTSEHPFYVNNSWVHAGDLKAGDSLFVKTGKTKIAVQRITVIDTVVTVYNITVAEAHDYYVGRSKVLVHNNPCAQTAKGGVQYTKSSLQLGQQMHKAYKVGANGVKEFRLPSGRRIDFLDIKNGTIYELKPFNPRAMQAGKKQLQMYMQELQTMPQFKGINWKTVLDTY